MSESGGIGSHLEDEEGIRKEGRRRALVDLQISFIHFDLSAPRP